MVYKVILKEQVEVIANLTVQVLHVRAETVGDAEMKALRYAAREWGNMPLRVASVEETNIVLVED